MLFRIDQSGPGPAVVVDADGQLHAESGIITHASEDLYGDVWF